MSELIYEDGILYDVVEKTANKTPNKIAYEFMGKKTTYAQFVNQIETVAKSLTGLGVKEEDIVCIAMPNVPQAIIMFYAVNKIGAIANMIHPLSSTQEMLTFLNKVECKTLLMMDQFYPSVKEIINQTSVKNLIVASVKEALPCIKKLPYAMTIGRKMPKITKADNVILWNDFVKKGKTSQTLPTVSDRTNKVAVILHSGGTTGKIKGVCLSNKNINACTTQMLSSNPFICGDDKMLSVMPIFHGNGLVIGVHTMFTVGARCVLIPRFTPKTYVHDLLKHKCNYMSGVPALFERMIMEPELQKADLSFLKGVFSGADSLSVPTEQKINAFLASHNASVRVRQGYGMTEGVVATTLNPFTKQKEGSVGIALPDVLVKIVEPNGEKELPCGEVGEIVMSSLTTMLGYYKDEEETNHILRTHADGKTYIHSGDLGYMDEEGYIYFKGRIKRMIVTNGYNVFPLELENVITKCDVVEGCCVVGIPNEQRGEIVKAFVILKQGVSKDDTTKQKIKDFCSTAIAKYAMPKEIEFIDEFPKTKVGKVDFKALMHYLSTNKKIDILTNIYAKYDVEHLLNDGSPKDEYASEAKYTVEYLTNNNTKNGLREYLKKIFDNQFSDNIPIDRFTDMENDIIKELHLS